MISGTLKAMNFKFGRNIRRLTPSKRPQKILETRGRGRSQGLSKIFRAAIYMAHRAVVFAIARLSCLKRHFKKNVVIFFLKSEKNVKCVFSNTACMHSTAQCPRTPHNHCWHHWLEIGDLFRNGMKRKEWGSNFGGINEKNNVREEVYIRLVTIQSISCGNLTFANCNN